MRVSEFPAAGRKKAPSEDGAQIPDKAYLEHKIGFVFMLR